MTRSCMCSRFTIASSEEDVSQLQKNLQKYAEHPFSWKSLFKCSICGQFWEKNYPAAGDVCCVEPELHRVKIENYLEEYHLNQKI